MDQKNNLADYIKRLQILDKEIDENPDGIEFMEELNSVLNGLSKDIQLDVSKKALSSTLNFMNLSNNPDPQFAHEGDSGFDLRAYIQNVPAYTIIEPWRVKTIPTGLYFEVEKGLEIQARSRSGLADKFFVFVLNSPGTIDCRYRGEVKIILANLGEEPFRINNGDRIAQGVVCPVYGEGRLDMVKQEKLSETIRNTQGFGSSGVQ